MFIEMELREIHINDQGQAQVIVLGEIDGDRVFPIFIGTFEAYAMDIAVKGKTTPRPMTHDLICNIVDELNYSFKSVLVDELKNDTFYGKVVLTSNTGEDVWIDSRPSDAIVLAAKRNLPIFVASEVLEKVTMGDEDEM